MAKDKVWYDIPRVGSKHRGGWIYRGYSTTEHDLELELHDLKMKGYETKTKKSSRPSRWDIYYRGHLLPKRKSQFID